MHKPLCLEAHGVALARGVYLRLVDAISIKVERDISTDLPEHAIIRMEERR